MKAKRSNADLFIMIVMAVAIVIQWYHMARYSILTTEAIDQTKQCITDLKEVGGIANRCLDERIKEEESKIVWPKIQCEGGY